jgi:thiol-disulfide isomerase/thioredoxin
MKRFYLAILIFFALISCSQHSKYVHPVIPPSSIVKNLMSWLYYERDYMVWSADYVALDTASNLITKKKFLERLTTGEFFPVKISTSDSSLCYQLYKLEDSVGEDIRRTIKMKAQMEHQYFAMEGKPLPQFRFVDLNGNIYDTNTTKGKILVLNCWFIRCKPCKEEIPKLNQLVKQFENRKDILFVALAFDSAIDLEKFLKKTVFDYAIVPGKEDYLMNVLKIISYPTHVIVNKHGIIVKIIESSFTEFINDLNKEMGMSEEMLKQSGSLPPPPPPPSSASKPKSQ